MLIYAILAAALVALVVLIYFCLLLRWEHARSEKSLRHDGP